MTASDLIHEYNLPVLTVALVQTSGALNVVFSFAVTQDGKRQQLAVLEALAEEFGLPTTMDACEFEESLSTPFRLPDFLIPSLESLVTSYVSSEMPLWLEFIEPAGLLPALPWEQLLEPFGHAVLRLPSLSLMPEAPAQSLDCVICFSSPKSEACLPEQLVRDFVSLIPPDLSQHVSFHVFADASVQPLLRDLKLQFESVFKINIYDPLAAREYKTIAETNPSPGSIENPWLLWMRDSLRGVSADVVHFICHGYVDRGRGGLCLAESPLLNSRRDYTSFLYAGELSAFLNDVGAWSAAFTSPLGNYSPAGLRLLQHEISKLRPGPVLLHDMVLAAHDDLGNVYRFLYSAQPHPPVRSSAISLYTHPRGTLKVGGASAASSARLLDEYTLHSRLRGKKSKWVASSQRILEQAALRVDSSDMATPEAKKAAQEAFRWVAERISAHADSEDSTEGPK